MWMSYYCRACWPLELIKAKTGTCNFKVNFSLWTMSWIRVLYNFGPFFFSSVVCLLTETPNTSYVYKTVLLYHYDLMQWQDCLWNTNLSVFTYSLLWCILAQYWTCHWNNNGDVCEVYYKPRSTRYLCWPQLVYKPVFSTLYPSVCTKLLYFCSVSESYRNLPWCHARHNLVGVVCLVTEENLLVYPALFLKFTRTCTRCHIYGRWGRVLMCL